MNADGAVTISDVGLWLKWLYFWPGDTTVQLVGPTAIGRFLEISEASYGGLGSGIVSLIAWSAVISLLSVLDQPFRTKK